MHSPLPWKQHPGPYAGQPPLLSADGMVSEYFINADDIPFIVRAANNHEWLLDALEAILPDYEHCAPDADGNTSRWRLNLMKKARDVIKEAKK